MKGVLPSAFVIALFIMVPLWDVRGTTEHLSLEATPTKETYRQGETIEISLKAIAKGGNVTISMVRYDVEYVMWGESGFMIYSAAREYGLCLAGTECFAWHYLLSFPLTTIAPPGRYVFHFTAVDGDKNVIGSASAVVYLASDPRSSIEQLGKEFLSAAFQFFEIVTGQGTITQSASFQLKDFFALVVTAFIAEAGGRLLRRHFGKDQLGSLRGERILTDRIIFVTTTPFIALAIIVAAGPLIETSLIEQLVGTAILVWTQFGYAAYLVKRGAIKIRWDYYAIGYVQLIVNAMILKVPFGIPFIGIRSRRDSRQGWRLEVMLLSGWLVIALAAELIGYHQAGWLMLMGLVYYTLPLEGTNGRLLWKSIIGKVMRRRL